MTSTAIVIAIGNSDNKLSQAQWSLFYEDVDTIICHYEQLAGVTVHGRWVSPSTAPWQNAAWSIEVVDEMLPHTRHMQWDLQRSLAVFGQDSLAWTVGQTRLLPAKAHEADKPPLDQQAEQSFEPVQGDPRVTGRWSCGCSSRECDLLWVAGRDASADPSQVLRVTCQTHAIFGDSESARVAANEGMRQQAQALHKLDLAHGEQCR